MKTHRILVTLYTALLALGLHAAESPVTDAAPPESAEDVEEQLDQSLKRFGYLAGLARGCVTAEQRPALESEAVDLAAGIARLLGTDRAFMFSAAFGYGTSLELEVGECAEVLGNYEKRVASFRARVARNAE